MHAIVATSTAPTRSNIDEITYYPALDWLRFVLAAVVVLYHETVPLPAPIDGSLAVQVFLALSGWLIGGILLNSRPNDLPRFFYNRVTRIWPPYLFTVTLLYSLAAVRHGIDVNWFKYLFYDVTFTHYTFISLNDAITEMPLGGTGGHFWTISIEEQFYLIAPLVILYTLEKRRLFSWIMISCTLLISHSAFSAIALGVTAAIINRDYYTVLRGTKVKIIALGAAAVLLLVLRLLNITPLREIFSVLLVYGLTVPGRRKSTGALFGAISYPLYLNHWLGGFFIQAVDKKIVHLSPVITQVFSFLNSVLLAYIAWYIIDRQIMKYRGGWYSAIKGYICLSMSYSLVGIGMVGGLIIMLLP